MLTKFLAISPVILLMSCASLSEDACRGGNWNAIGFNDGENGRSQGYISEHSEACAEYGITPDSAAWLRGRIEGLKQYCTRPNAYTIGRHGSDLRPVCNNDQAGLRLANFYGMRYYEIGREISTLEREENDLLHKVENDFTGELTPEQRELQRFHLSRIRQINREIRDLEWEKQKYAQLP